MQTNPQYMAMFLKYMAHKKQLLGHVLLRLTPCDRCAEHRAMNAAAESDTRAVFPSGGTVNPDSAVQYLPLACTLALAPPDL